MKILRATHVGPSAVTAIPPRPGHYVRTHKLGCSVDYWDGSIWRRPSVTHCVDPKARIGVVCANQDLPWKMIA